MRTMLARRRLNLRCRTANLRADCLLLVAVIAIAFVAPVDAQQFNVDPVDPKAKNQGAVVQLCLRSPAEYAAKKAQFDEYFTGYYFPEMTQINEANLGRLGDLRYNLFKRYLWATTDPQVQAGLTALADKEMRRIAGGSYHPAVRYNAILVLGMLDDKYSTGAEPPVPHARANALLTGVVNAGMGDKVVAPSLVLGAIVGLDRHAQFRQGLQPAAVAAMTAALVKLVEREQTIQDMNRESYDWLRMKAAGVLAKLGNVGQNNAVHNALIKLIASSKSLDDRCDVAAMLAKLNYKDVKLDAAGTAEPLFALARDVGAAETKRAEEFEAPISGSVGGPGAPGGGPFTQIGPDGQPPEFPRREVLSRLLDLRAGLELFGSKQDPAKPNVAKPTLPEDVQKKFDAILAAINPVITAASSKDTVDLKLTVAIRNMASAIDSAVPPPVKAEAEDADTF
jgi:hypothetical protein